jgi:hypothetical protein
MPRKIYNGLDLQDQRIVKLGDPVALTDAVNRKFLEDALLGADQKKLSLNLGDGVSTTFVITHNFGTRDVVVSVYDLATNEVVLPDVTHTSTNTVTITFGAIPAADTYRAVVIG